MEEFILDDKFILVDDTITRNTQINSQEYGMYVASLLLVGIQSVSKLMVGSYTLCYALEGLNPIPKRSINTANINIKSLMRKVDCGITQSAHQSLYIIDPEVLRNYPKYATKVYVSEIYTIMNTGLRYRKDLLKYYILLLTLLAGKKENCILAAKWTIEQLCIRSGLSKDTVCKYNKTLCDLQLIYFYDKYIFDDKGKCQSTIFATWRNKHHVQRYINHYYPDSVPVSKATVNQRRSYAMMYRWLCEGKQYDAETLEKIKEYSINHNQKLQAKIDKPNTSDAEREYLRTKLFDLSVLKRGDCM